MFAVQVEVAPMLIPYMPKLTKSEMHAIMTSGFATVAGSILAIYNDKGVQYVYTFLVQYWLRVTKVFKF